ncbi:MAG: VacJ family lipoprotein [Sphingomonadaceae bacterium]
MTLPILAAAIFAASPNHAPIPETAIIAYAPYRAAHVLEVAPSIMPDVSAVAATGDAVTQSPEIEPALPSSGSGNDPWAAPEVTEGTIIGPIDTTGDEPADSELLPEDEPYVITVTGRTSAPPGDPLIQLNEKTYAITQKVDEAIIGPVAKGYQEKLPGPIRKGLSNFFSNLREPVVFLNFLLQGKPGKAAETMGRFMINTTAGVAGLFDVAKKEPFNLPYRNNGFANTLGYYGVEPGAFLMVPLIGATSLRDLIGSGIDSITLGGLIGSTSVGSIFRHPGYVVSSYTVRSLDERIAMDDRVEAIRDADYPYETMRETYLCYRLAEIEALHGRTITADDCGESAILPENVLPSAQASQIETSAAQPTIEPDMTISVEPVIEFYSKPIVQPIS